VVLQTKARETGDLAEVPVLEDKEVKAADRAAVAFKDLATQQLAPETRATSLVIRLGAKH
jgi:carbamate kinase